MGPTYPPGEIEPFISISISFIFLMLGEGGRRGGGEGDSEGRREERSEVVRDDGQYGHHVSMSHYGC